MLIVSNHYLLADAEVFKYIFKHFIISYISHNI